MTVDIVSEYPSAGLTLKCGTPGTLKCGAPGTLKCGTPGTLISLKCETPGTWCRLEDGQGVGPGLPTSSCPETCGESGIGLCGNAYRYYVIPSLFPHYHLVYIIIHMCRASARLLRLLVRGTSHKNKFQYQLSVSQYSQHYLGLIIIMCTPPPPPTPP